MAFSDDFNRANENLEASSDWTRVDGSAGMATVTSNAVNCATADSNGAAYQCPDQGAGDKYMECALNLSGNAFALAMRLTDRSNYVGARSRGGNVEVYKRVSGSFTSLGSAAVSYSAGKVMRLEMEGDIFKLYYDGVLEVTTGPESFNSSETRQGCVARSVSSAWFDDFEAGLSAVPTRRYSGMRGLNRMGA